MNLDKLLAFALILTGMLTGFVGVFMVFGLGMALIVAGVVFAALGFSLARVSIG